MIYWIIIFAMIYLGVKLFVDFTFFKDEIRAAIERDPACKGPFTIIFLSPGFKALKYHRFSHAAWKAKICVLAQWISHFTRRRTGIEIHPGAEIGKGVFIDHGMGVVIGETAIVGNNVTMFQQVTLGGTGKETGKRHPTIGENVVIGAGAKVLGNILVEKNVFIGANAVVVRDVPEGSTVVGVPGRVVAAGGRRVQGISLDHTHLPDPIAKSLEVLQHEIDVIEDAIKDHRGSIDAKKKN